MAIKPQYSPFKYYEGVCSNKDIVAEIAKVLAIGVRSKEIKDADGNVLQAPFILQSKNWDIVYPAADASLEIDWENMTPWDYQKKILNQVSKISDTVILKTETTPVDTVATIDDDLSVDPDDMKASLTMFLELYKPTYIADPEQYPLDCERMGIIPKLTTEELYVESYKDSINVEEVISTEESGCCKVEEATNTYSGIVSLASDSECTLYATKIGNIYGTTAGDEGFYAPINADVGTQTSTISFDASRLARVKTKDAELYNLILNNLGGGIDSKTYSQLSKVSFYIMKNATDYSLSISGEREFTMYTINGTFFLKNQPLDAIVPEFYLNGIYIPLSETQFTILDKNKIKFLETIKGEVGENGNLVVRYRMTNPSSTITQRKTLVNNHYLLARIFDNINEDGTAPMDDVYTSNGELLKQNSHVSDWAKLSWYKDFEEKFVDYLDADSGTSNVNDGVVKVPLETLGLNSETKIRYYINTNNDRFSLVVMGNPSLDYMQDRHLIGACYCGKIDSFSGSINDVAGNFSLFTSSSTEPCNTQLSVEKVYHEMDATNFSTENAPGIFLDCYSTQCISGQRQYYITLPEGKFFDRDNWAKYCVVDANGNQVTNGFITVHQVNFTSDSEAVLTIHNDYDASYTLYVYYPWYEEKYVITSGITRDMFGNVMDVRKTQTFGRNTSDGVTSVMMYHTRSKAYYQKHHMMFTTTEEYMSKVMYGKSAYTGEYYADKIKITHGNDGPRGTMNDILVIDNESLYPLDELVINKDFEKDPDAKEETYIYFPITAPFSPLSDSPNSQYGLAIKKLDKDPTYEDEDVILRIAKEELTLISSNSWWGITSNIYPISSTSNGCKIYWDVVDDSDWYETQDNRTGFQPIDLAIVPTSVYAGDTSEAAKLRPLALILEQGTTPGTDASSTVKIATGTLFELAQDETLYYGVSDKEIKTLGYEAQIKAIITDICKENPETFEYSINGVPYVKMETHPKTFAVGDELTLPNATPDKYLVLYSVKEEPDKGKYSITRFSCVKLQDSEQDPNRLLQFPCSINAYITAGMGQLKSSSSAVVPYGNSYKVLVLPSDGWQVTKITINDVDQMVTQIAQDGATYEGCEIDSVTKDMTIKVELEIIA